MKKLLTAILSLTILCTLSPLAYASSAAEPADSDGSLSVSEIESLICDSSFSLDAEDGATATYIIYKDESGNAVIEAYDSEIMPCLDYTPGDGVLEYAVFHLGFKNWTSTSTTGDLYYTLTADEKIQTVAGTAYVENPSALYTLLHGAYYKDTWYHTIKGGSTYISKSLEDDIDVGDIDEVKVGFESVTITTTENRGGSFVNSSKLVTK